MRNATIKDVALEAGVSPMTVSRVVNGQTGVKPQNREKVLKAIEKVKYRPNIGARALSGKRTYQLVMLYNNPNIGWMGELMIGALKSCRKAGYHLSVEFTEEFGLHSSGASFSREELVEMVSPSRVDGVVLPSPICFDLTVLDVISEFGIPCVRIAGTPARGLKLRVNIDNLAAGYEITNYLIGLGHENIAIIKGPEMFVASGQRYGGYAAAMRDHGLVVRESNVLTGLFDFESGFDCTQKLLKQENPPTAIFASNDEMAAGALAAARELDIKVPDQLSVAGFDDAPIAHSIWPQLTTVRQPMRTIGENAVRLLIDHIRELPNENSSAETENITLPYELVIRRSTAPCPVNRG